MYNSYNGIRFFLLKVLQVENVFEVEYTSEYLTGADITVVTFTKTAYT